MSTTYQSKRREREEYIRPTDRNQYWSQAVQRALDQLSAQQRVTEQSRMESGFRGSAA